MLIMPSFKKKSLIGEQFQGNYLKLVKEQSLILCNSVTYSDSISDKIPHTYKGRFYQILCHVMHVMCYRPFDRSMGLWIITERLNSS